MAREEHAVAGTAEIKRSMQHISATDVYGVGVWVGSGGSTKKDQSRQTTDT
jgi:hypothetical protein